MICVPNFERVNNEFCQIDLKVAELYNCMYFACELNLVLFFLNKKKTFQI